MATAAHDSDVEGASSRSVTTSKDREVAPSPRSLLVVHLREGIIVALEGDLHKMRIGHKGMKNQFWK